MQKARPVQELLDCAMNKIIARVWECAYERVNGVYAVRRKARLGEDTRDQLQLYCVAFDSDPPPLIELLEPARFHEARSVILIGNCWEPTIRLLRVEGFDQDWETEIYVTQSSSSSTASMSPHLPNGMRFEDVTKAEIAIANSFCEDFGISESSVLDSSFISKLLFSHDTCVGKIQLILCPPWGVFCTLVAVREGHRRRGYFTLMMKAAEAWALEQALSRLALFSGAYANEISLYARRAYIPIGRYTIMKRRAAEQ